MHLIIPIVNYLLRKYGVPLHNFFEFSARGTSDFKFSKQNFHSNGDLTSFDVLITVHVIYPSA